MSKDDKPQPNVEGFAIDRLVKLIGNWVRAVWGDDVLNDRGERDCGHTLPKRRVVSDHKRVTCQGCLEMV